MYLHKEVADMPRISVKTFSDYQTTLGEKFRMHAQTGLIEFAIQKESL